MSGWGIGDSEVVKLRSAESAQEMPGLMVVRRNFRQPKWRGDEGGLLSTESVQQPEDSRSSREAGLLIWARPSRCDMNMCQVAYLTTQLSTSTFYQCLLRHPCGSTFRRITFGERKLHARQARNLAAPFDASGTPGVGLVGFDRLQCPYSNLDSNSKVPGDQGRRI